MYWLFEVMTSTLENKTCLHLVTRSSGDALERCSAFCSRGDDVLFVDDAVLFLVSEQAVSHFNGLARPFFLKADLEARGLADIAFERDVPIVTDLDFVDLLRKHDSCLTWK